ncbi:MAG: DNA polymerase III subunit alpha [Desulfobacterales bacterium]|jgi:DNA polymerase-3 subunit alpha
MPAPAADFVHLHVHTQYSLLDGAIRIDPLLDQAQAYGMEAVAITDHGTMFGVLEFHEKAKKAGLRPVLGCEIYVAPRTINDKTPEDAKGLRHLVLIAENQEGYRNLCKLASIAQLEGFYYRPRIDKQLLAEHSRGLIGLTACLHGEIPMHIKAGRIEAAEESARWYQQVLGEDNFFLEVQHNGIPIQETVNAALREISAKLSIPLVASNDCHYLQKEDVRAHDVLLCIQTGKTVHESNRFKFSTDQLYFKAPGEMTAYFRDYPGAVENTVNIARRCAYEFDFSYHFPQFSAAADLTTEEIFERTVRQGFAARLAKIREKYPQRDLDAYTKRLDYEISVITEMGFTGYFLIVADFIRFAKENGVPVGPGRGSAAGSMVAYAMGITDLDPIEHGLIFERFLNPARISMPDIDVDFCINGREKVLEYVSAKYGGGDYVAQIITYGKLKTRAVIRDVGRALDIPLKEVDTIAKMVPDVLNIKLDEAIAREPKFNELAAARPEIDDLLKICRVLEGLPRHASTHAAGVVIGDKPLVEYLPLYRGKKGEVVTQFDMKHVELAGLVKFDFLGLRNLTVIENTLQLIAAQQQPVPDMVNIDLDDQATFSLLSRGDTTGVFQLESAGMKDLLVRLKPASFADITALVALYRPGPLDSGMVDDFVERKHGRKAVEYLLPELAPILEETYGVILYQEQVMKIAAVLANYTMAKADDLRKAMGKKIAEKMAEHRQFFMDGAKENQIPEDKDGTVFDLMEKFGGYGFNKSHSAAYALIAYQTAYLKAHYPVEFLAALLTSEMHSTDGVVKFMAECRSHGIDVRPPNINQSGITFAVEQGQIRYGLVAVKNVGEAAIEAIVAEREANGVFASLFDFCSRVDLRRVNKRVIESLIHCGAFDDTGAKRSQMMAALEDALEYGQRVQKEKADPQMGLFGTVESAPTLNAPELPPIEEWEARHALALEKEALGFYLSGHPLDRNLETLEKFTNANAISIKELPDEAPVRIGGLISGIRRLRTKRGDQMAFVQIDDLQGTTELIVFPEAYRESEALLVEDQAVLVQGQAQKEENAVRVVAEKIVAMDRAEETWTASVHITLDSAMVTADMLERLHQLLRKHRGSCRTFLHLLNGQQSETVIAAEDMALKAGAALDREVGALLGYAAVKTVCSPVVATNGESRGRRRKPYRS